MPGSPMTITIYHNPRCSKSRRTLDILTDAGCTPRVVHYLDDPPSVGELRTLCAMLDITPRELIRTGEQAYRDLGLDKPDIGGDALLEAMHENPILIQRPIVVSGRNARIGRPPEAVVELLEQDDGS